MVDASTSRLRESVMTLLDHVVLQVDDLTAIGDWYDQVVSLAGGTRTFDAPNLIGCALPGEPAQLFFSLATDPGGRQTHLALRVEDEVTVRRGHEFATGVGAEILHEPRLWPDTHRTTTPSSSVTQPETTSNSHAAPRRHSQLTHARRRNTHHDHDQHHRLGQHGHRHRHPGGEARPHH